MNAPEATGGTRRTVATNLIQRYGGKRSQHALTAIAAAELLAPVARTAWNRIRHQMPYSVSIDGADEIYTDVQTWILERLPKKARKALLVASDAPYSNAQPDGGSSSAEQAQLLIAYDGSRQQALDVDGHRVLVNVEKESLGGSGEHFLREKITFFARNEQGRDAVIRMIRATLDAKYAEARKPALFMPSRWGGGWARRGDLPTRDLDSVVLKEGQLERLAGDLRRFLAAEDLYVELSQPWHRGYLFHGAPGTGKTSIARALATHFGLPTYYLPLGDIERDTNLMDYVAQIQPRSVLLIEDVDVFHAATDREDDSKKVSVAGMLNSLDGIWTPHGLITILTTNEREKLDSALIRAGRVDVDEEFTVLDQGQATAIVERFGVPVDPAPFVGRSPADLIKGIREAVA